MTPALSAPSIARPISAPLRDTDQAATLRRWFARRQVRVLPVCCGTTPEIQTSTWLAKWAQAFVRAGQRTLVIDAARVHIAAALGLRARHDLQHVFTGECALPDVLLDAAHGLHVVPAVRAFDAAVPSAAGRVMSSMSSYRQALGVVLPQLARAADCDLVLLLFTPAQAALLPAGVDCVLPVYRLSGHSGHSSQSDRHAAQVIRTISQLEARADIAGFRLLFLGMNDVAAITLASVLASRLRASSGMGRERLQMGGHARLAPDLVHVVRAATGWRSAVLTTDATECMV